MFRPIDAMKVKVGTCKSPVPSSKFPIISQKFKIQVTSVTIKLSEEDIWSMLASNKLALSVLARFAGWPGESASWPVQVSFRLPLLLFAFCCRSFSSSFVTEVISSPLNHLVLLLSVTRSLQLIKYLCIEWLASRITPSQVFYSEFFFPLTNFFETGTRIKTVSPL